MDKNNSRMIGNLAVINAWFDPVDDTPDRYSLHVNASFRTERLGGDAESNIRFRIRLKRCEVVVIVPDRGRTFRVDPRSISMTPPQQALELTRRRQSDSKQGVGGEASVDETGIKAKVFGSKSKQSEQTQTEADTQVIPILNTLHSLSVDGYPSWTVSGDYEGFLGGSLWNPHVEPRLTVIDNRPEDQKTLDRERGLDPHATVEIRCKREDIDIDEISFKNLEKAKQVQNKAGHVSRMRAAEAFLKLELQKEGLRVGDLGELFSDMVVADFVVPLNE